MMILTAAKKKKLRVLGHNLHPVVMVSDKGLTEGVLLEAGRALNDHELIKVRFAVADREIKRQLAARLTESLGAQSIQIIGHILLMYKPAKKPNPRLSNLLRYK